MITKAILTGGGHATRLRPITTTINKHLIPLANKPMIFHAIEKVVKAGVKDIFINTNPGETELQKVVGDGSRWGINITYFEQTGGPQGIAHVVNVAHQFIGDDPFMFYLSDNIILSDLNNLVDKFEKENCDCMLALSKVQDPERFGVPYFNEDGKLIDIVEKPENPPNDFAVTGIYLYGPKLFFEAFKNIKKSHRGEYEISDLHSYLLKNNFNVGYQEITGWWKDTGKPDDLIKASALLMDQLSDDFFQIESASFDDSAKWENRVFIGKNSVVGENVVITGPVIIGQNCKMENCTIGPHTTIGDNSSISKANISNSLIFSDCNINCDVKISNSILGKNAQVIGRDQGNGHKLIIGDSTLVEM